MGAIHEQATRPKGKLAPSWPMELGGAAGSACGGRREEVLVTAAAEQTPASPTSPASRQRSVEDASRAEAAAEAERLVEELTAEVEAALQRRAGLPCRDRR